MTNEELTEIYDKEQKGNVKKRQNQRETKEILRRAFNRKMSSRVKIQRMRWTISIYLMLTALEQKTLCQWAVGSRPLRQLWGPGLELPWLA